MGSIKSFNEFVIFLNEGRVVEQANIEQAFNSLAREFEVAKNQKLSGTAKGSTMSSCEACKLSKTGLFYQEADKILSTYKKGSPEMSKAVSDMLCYNQKVYYGDFKNWCPDGYSLQSILSKELNCKTFDECKQKIDYYMKHLFTQREPIDWHLVLTISSIATAFIPFVGPFISAGIDLADAAYYYNQGDKKTAGFVGMFAILPLISKIPGVKELGKKGMSTLATKLLNKSELTPLEKEVAESLAKNKDEISKELSAFSKKATYQKFREEADRIIDFNRHKHYFPDEKSISKAVDNLMSISSEAELLKSNYIKKYGQNEYEIILRGYLLDGDKKVFLDQLKNVKNPNIQIKPVFGEGRDHRVYQSKLYPDRIFKVELAPGEVDKWFTIFKENPDIFPKIYKKTKMKDKQGKIFSSVVLEKLETKKFTKLWSELEGEMAELFKNIPSSKRSTSLEGLVSRDALFIPEYKNLWEQLLNHIKNTRPEMYSQVNEFSELINKLHKITKTPDVRKFNFGYDKQGVLKCLDI
jgi:hypothetical protein